MSQLTSADFGLLLKGLTILDSRFTLSIQSGSLTFQGTRIVETSFESIFSMCFVVFVKVGEVGLSNFSVWVRLCLNKLLLR